ncbi:MAG: hypothetical protein R3185_02440 [Candidatus Thermoplasmatota archaeon]|nr:hypothetical protein [Candidatus Thermoplasmatota archaeon]
MRTLIPAILLTALLMTVPATLAQGTEDYSTDEDSGYDDGPVEVTMYHHVYNLLDKVPMNTQPMDAAVPDIAKGFSFPTAATPAAEAPVSNPNSLYMYNSPGPVHYNTSLREPRFHPERGLAEDLHLSGDPMTVYWYMSADALESTAGEGPFQAGVMPQVTVQATLRLGDDVGGNLDDGQIVAQGQTTMDIMTQPGGGVTEIPITLDNVQMNTIPKDESFNLKIEWWQVNDGGVKYMDRQWNLHSGQDFPNRLVFTVENPIRINYVHPQPIGDRKIAFHTAFVTPFGNYDVDLNKLQFTLTDADGNQITPESLQGPIIVQKSYVHNHHFEPVLATWVWNYRADEAPAGDYTIEVEASNYQGSATASKAATFRIQEQGKAQGFSSSGEEIQALDDNAGEETNDSPLGSMVTLAGALLAASLIAQRRRRD